MCFAIENDARELIEAGRGACCTLSGTDRDRSVQYVFDGTEFCLESLPVPGLLRPATTLIEEVMSNCTVCDGEHGSCVVPCPMAIDGVMVDLIAMPSNGVYPEGTCEIVHRSEGHFYERGRMAARSGPMIVADYDDLVYLQHLFHDSSGNPIDRGFVFQSNVAGYGQDKLEDLRRKIAMPAEWLQEVAIIKAFMVR